MIQLNMQNPKEPRLRPHFRLNDSKYPWIALEGNAVNLNDLNLKNPITLNEWFKVKIIVRGTEIDIYLNEQHVFHYFLPDPFKFEKGSSVSEGEKVLSKEIVVVSYPIGRVGFRCAPQTEHSHFRKVTVKPLL